MLRTGQIFLFPYSCSVFDDGIMHCKGKSIVLKSKFCNLNYFTKICYNKEKSVSTDRTLFA